MTSTLQAGEHAVRGEHLLDADCSLDLVHVNPWFWRVRHSDLTNDKASSYHKILFLYKGNVKQRYVETIRLLTAWAPLTVEDVFRASRAYEKPFSSMKQCREELQVMYRARLLGREAIPGGGRGQKPFAYYLARRAAALVPEVGDIPKSNSVFHGLGESPFHALATGQFWSLFEAWAAEHAEVKVLERIRDRQFIAELDDHSKLVPDGTVLVEIHGRRKLFFLELVHQTGVINPGAEASRARSLTGKLDNYRAFREAAKSHPTWTYLERAYGPIGGFQVLIVTTRRNRQYLLSAAEGARTMFLFADLDELRSRGCLFHEPLWWLPRSPWRQRGPERTTLLEH